MGLGEVETEEFERRGAGWARASLPLGIAFELGAAVLFALGAVLCRKGFPLLPVALTAWKVGLG